MFPGAMGETVVSSVYAWWEPFVCDAPYPRAVVTRAVWDDGAKALVLTMVPGTDTADKVAFSVRNLDPSADWQITRNGVRVAELEQGVVKGNASPADVTWADGVLRVTTGLREEETVVVAKRAGS